tara:strand:- start:320 stop:1192 length:873 start_codon:yes stop_codon:yes gene_type:complete
MKNILFIVVFLFLVVCCRPKPIDITLDSYESKIVVASQIVPDYVMMVGLTRSFTILSNAGYDSEGDLETFTSLLIDSALVTVESESGIDTLYMLSPGLFGSVGKLEKTGGAYHLRVVDYGLNKVAEATSIMQENVPLDTVIPSLHIEGGDTTIDIDLLFRDIASQSNFYVLSVYSRNSNKDGLDINAFFKNGSNNIEYQELIHDEGQNGNMIKRSFNLSSISPDDSLMVLLSNISEGYFRFLESRDRSGNPLSEITSEPVNYPSNVNNGLGYFNTHYPSIRFFDLKELRD